MTIRSVAVFCGSSVGTNPLYQETAHAVGSDIARRFWRLIYGAGNIGLMGTVADACLAEGGWVTGVIPRFLVDWEVCHDGLSELITVETMHARKQVMAERADAFLALPGGFGTMDELFEIITWRQLHLHSKPIGLLTVGGLGETLIAWCDQLVANGFVSPEVRSYLHTDHNYTRLLDRLEALTT